MINKRIEPETWHSYAKEIYTNTSVITNTREKTIIKGPHTNRLVDDHTYSVWEDKTIGDYIQTINTFIYENQNTFTYEKDINDMRKQLFECIKHNFLFVDYIELVSTVDNYRFVNLNMVFDYHIPEINFNTTIEIKLPFEIQSNSIKRSHKNKTFKIGTQALTFLHDAYSISWRGISTDPVSKKDRIFFKKRDDASYNDILLDLTKNTFSYFRKEIIVDIDSNIIMSIPNAIAVMKYISPERHVERLHMIDPSLNENSSFEDIYKKIIENKLYED